MKCSDQFTDFVAGPPLVADFEVAIADAKGGVAETADRLGDALGHAQTAQHGQSNSDDPESDDDDRRRPRHLRQTLLPIGELGSFSVDGGVDQRAETGCAALESIPQFHHDRGRGVLRRETCDSIALADDVVVGELDVVLEGEVVAAVDRAHRQIV
jgi:hypothetical protein